MSVSRGIWWVRHPHPQQVKQRQQRERARMHLPALQVIGVDSYWECEKIVRVLMWVGMSCCRWFEEGMMKNSTPGNSLTSKEEHATRREICMRLHGVSRHMDEPDWRQWSVALVSANEFDCEIIEMSDCDWWWWGVRVGWVNHLREPTLRTYHQQVQLNLCEMMGERIFLCDVRVEVYWQHWQQRWGAVPAM